MARKVASLTGQTNDSNVLRLSNREIAKRTQRILAGAPVSGSNIHITVKRGNKKINRSLVHATIMDAVVQVSGLVREGWCPI